jgi:hypothetical protein
VSVSIHPIVVALCSFESIRMAVVDAAFLLAVASDTGPELSAVIACIAGRPFAAVVPVSCNVVVGWGCEACSAVGLGSAGGC